MVESKSRVSGGQMGGQPPKKGCLCMVEQANLVFHNKEIDGTVMKRFISRLIDHFGMRYTTHIPRAGPGGGQGMPSP